MTAFKALVTLEYHQAKRRLSSFLTGIGMPVGFFLLFSSLWSGDVPKAELSLLLKQSLFSMTAFSCISFAFFTLPISIQEDRTSQFTKMLAQSPIHQWQYYTAKILRIATCFICSIVVVFGSGYLFRGISMPVLDWIVTGGLLFLGGICFLPLGIVLSALPSSETLSVISNVLYLGLALLGGLWMPTESFPEQMQIISKLTPTYHYKQLVVSYVNHQFSWKSVAILGFYAIVLSVTSAVLTKKQKG
ncbi:ABC transporter permease [Streptococcus phocae subsp. salmonis]|uniref:ABC transporter permease n=1 Tax=Streptococcus phocae TaxID=119224 RepID=UPI00053168DC|nr:ABC transporter permease [Streptococcus phocae]KGR73251.1 ABC transporter [Streptococcus phocae subsp. salmonis]